MRLGVQVVVRYSHLSVSEELLSAADISEPITASTCHEWTFLKFRQNHPQYRVYAPNNSEPDAVRREWQHRRAGIWNGRKVEVFSPPNQSGESVLFVARGKHLLEHGIENWNPDDTKLGTALELSFGGKVMWE